MSHRRTLDPYSPNTPTVDSDHFFLSPTSPNYSPIPPPSFDTARTSSITSRTRLKVACKIHRWTPTFHWFVPTAMVVVFLAGCLGAVSHHLFYRYLHGRSAENQLVISRIGVAIAFFTKASLVGSVVLAYRQRVWRTMRRKPISLSGLDALFQVVESPVWFFMGKEMFVKARVASLMAAATWIIPIASVLAPGALTAQMTQVEFGPHGECIVSSLNFSKEVENDWRPREKNKGYHLAFWNTTPPPPETAVVDWYDQPSFQTERLTQLAYLGKNVLAEEQNPCGRWNCSYSTSFHAPWYNCTSVPFSSTPFILSTFVPHSPPLAAGGINYIYRAVLPPNSTVYTRPYSPDYNSSTYTSQGTFFPPPPLYLAVVENTTKPIPGVGKNSRWNHTLLPQAYECRHQKALYNVTSVWASNRLVSRKAKVSDGIDQLPNGHLSPWDKKRYREYVAYYSIGVIMRELLMGDMVLDNQTMTPVTHTELTKTRLFIRIAQKPVPNFTASFQRFYEEMVMSFISEPDFMIAKTETVKCKKRRRENRFCYNPGSLWVGYAVVLTLAFLCLLLGTHSLVSNGYCSDTTFSKVLVTTRNPTLDKIILSYHGASLGSDPMPAKLQKLQLRYGVIEYEGKEGERERHAAFGVEGEVKTLTRRDVQGQVEGEEGLGIEMGGNRGRLGETEGSGGDVG